MEKLRASHDQLNHCNQFLCELQDDWLPVCCASQLARRILAKAVILYRLPPSIGLDSAELTAIRDCALNWCAKLTRFWLDDSIEEESQSAV